MPYTSHGHAYGDTTGHSQPARRARCGGPGICGQCSREAAQQPADTQTAADLIGDHGISPEEAAHVLHHFDEGGYRPGKFTGLLVEAMAAADPVNLAKLRVVFPGYGAAVRGARDDLGGIDALKRIARGRAVDGQIQETDGSGDVVCDDCAD